MSPPSSMSAPAQLDLHRLSSATSELKAEYYTEVRQIYEKSLKLDANTRAITAMSAELDQVRSDACKLAAVRKELTAQLNDVESKLARAHAEEQAVLTIKANIKAMRLELQ